MGNTYLNFFKSKKKISFLILLFAFCVGSIAYSQSASSLKSKEELSKKYEVKAKKFLKLPQFNLDSSDYYFNKALEVLKSEYALNFYAIASLHRSYYASLHKIEKSQKVDSSLLMARYYFDQIPRKSNETKLLEYEILISEAEVHFFNNRHALMNELLLKAFVLVQEDKSPAVQANFLYSKGNFYSRQLTQSLKLSNRYLLQSAKIYEQSKDSLKYEMLFNVYASLAWYQNNFGSPDSCDFYYNKQKALLPLLNSPVFNTFYTSTRANSYLRRKEYAKALPLLLDCQTICEKYKITNNEIYIFNTYLQGVMDMDFKNYNDAIQKINKGIKVAKYLKNSAFEKDGYENLTIVYTKMGDFKKAFEYKNMWTNLIVDELGKNLDKSYRENELKLDLERKNNEIIRKAKERNWYLAAMFTGLVLLSLVYKNFRSKQKSNKVLEQLNADLAEKNSLLDKRNAENELLLKEIHHRVKNNLEVVSSLLALQSAKIDDPEIQDAILASQNRVQSMGILHQKLYQSEHLAFIEMKNYFRNLCQNILDSYNESSRIKVNIEMSEIDLDVDTAIPVGLIVNELLTNALKYAFPTGREGVIKLSLESADKENFTLIIKDNGIGKIPNGIAKGTGFGTQLVDLLTRQINGKLAHEMNGGTTVTINFKREIVA
jgi:two-component system, sensor histidine kinase PdtaS